MEAHDVSVIIPTYNAADPIEKCLKSTYNQTYSCIEIIIVDNFSDDATTTITIALGARVLQQSTNPASARNTGITHSNGRYVFFVDSDQVLSKRVVEECVTKCEKANAGMVRIPEFFLGEGFWSSCSAEWKNHYGKIEQRFGAQGKILSGEPRFFVKEDIIRVGMFDAALVWGEDYDLYQRMKKRNVKEVFCESKLYHFEPVTVKEIVNKSLRYGESIPTFVRLTKRQVFSRLIRHSLLTWRSIFSELKEKPSIFLGCTLLLYMKAFSTTSGLLASLL